MADNLTHSLNRSRVLTIDDLPNDDLLAIFDFYVFKYQDRGFRQLGNFKTNDSKTKMEIESWQSLVHVCRRWRGLVFASPRRLNLHLCYKTRPPLREATLDIWPALPLHILGDIVSVDDVVVGLDHSDRIRQIDLFLYSTSQMEKLCTTAQVPFPELTVLRLAHNNNMFPYRPVLPDSFLGGSAPHLRYFCLDSVPFPGLPKLLPSATFLVQLHLRYIPHSGYIPPEAMAICLSILTSLESLQLEFQSPQSSPDQESRRPLSPIRSALPALTKFWFKGAKEYLEDLVSRIDIPRLYRLSTTFFDEIDFDTPELKQFISRTPTFGAYNVARLIIRSQAQESQLRLLSHREPSGHGMVQVRILFQQPYWQLSSLAQICISSLRPLLTMENLRIDVRSISPARWPDYSVNAEWLDFLLPFTAVKNLYLSKPVLPSIARALQELTAGGTTVLPALQNILLEGFHPSKPVQEDIAQFISARQLINHPVAISVWDSKKLGVELRQLRAVSIDD